MKMTINNNKNSKWISSKTVEAFVVVGLFFPLLCHSVPTSVSSSHLLPFGNSNLAALVYSSFIDVCPIELDTHTPTLPDDAVSKILNQLDTHQAVLFGALAATRHTREVIRSPAFYPTSVIVNTVRVLPILTQVVAGEERLLCLWCCWRGQQRENKQQQRER